MEFERTPVKRMTKQGSDIIKELYDHVFIAGGYARWCLSRTHSDMESVGDIDLYLRSRDSQQAAMDGLSSLGYSLDTEGYLSHHWNNYEEDCLEVQLIKPFEYPHALTVGSPKEVIKKFDFRISQAFIESKTFGIVNESFHEDDHNRVLVVQFVNRPIGTLIRAMKYYGKGFTMSWKELITILQRIDKIPDYEKARIYEIFLQSDDIEKMELTFLEGFELEAEEILSEQSPENLTMKP